MLNLACAVRFVLSFSTLTYSYVITFFISRSPRRHRSRERERPRSPPRQSHHSKRRDEGRLAEFMSRETFGVSTALLFRSTKKSKHSRKDKDSAASVEIREANELRAKLGLKPLRP